MSEIAKYIPNTTAPKPFEDFNPEKMQNFYAIRQLLQGIDATFLLDKCILGEQEVIEYEASYDQIYDPHYIARVWDSPLYKEHSYVQRCSKRTEVYVSTALLMNKLDATLYFWRELNPEVVRLLSSANSIRLEVVANWVKLIHYLGPPVPQANSF